MLNFKDYKLKQNILVIFHEFIIIIFTFNVNSSLYLYWKSATFNFPWINFINSYAMSSNINISTCFEYNYFCKNKWNFRSKITNLIRTFEKQSLNLSLIKKFLHKVSGTIWDQNPKSKIPYLQSLHFFPFHRKIMKNIYKTIESWHWSLFCEMVRH